MKKDTVASINQPGTTRDTSTKVLREGGTKTDRGSRSAELEERLEQYQGQQDGQGDDSGWFTMVSFPEITQSHDPSQFTARNRPHE